MACAVVPLKHAAFAAAAGALHNLQALITAQTATASGYTNQLGGAKPAKQS